MSADGHLDAIAAQRLRAAFVTALTVDGPINDRRRKDFNQAIFDAKNGWAIWSSTDLQMVLDKFDTAVRQVTS